MQIRHLRLTDLVYADDICLLAGSPQHLQALIDALVGYCDTLHIEISVAKTKVMVVSGSQTRSPVLEAAVFTEACIPPVARHRRHELLYSPSMTDTLCTSVGSSMLRLVLCCSRGQPSRVCTHCGSVAVADELQMILECPALQAIRQRYAPLFSTDTVTMRSFFAQQDHMQVIKFVLDCLDVFHI